MPRDQLKEAAVLRRIALLVIALSLAACATQKMERTENVVMTPDLLVKEAKAAIKEVTVDDVKKLIDANEKIVILDVRDKDEFVTGFIPGATNLSRGMLEFKVATVIPDKNARIFVYCGVDLRGPLATLTLNRMGYVNAVNIIGGLKAWRAAGNPVTRYPAQL
jgi:rhodanese-related sulfurtransferase